MTKRQEISAKIAELERTVFASNEQIAQLKAQLQDLPGGVLDFDPEAESRAEIARKNEALRKQGLLPSE